MKRVCFIVLLTLVCSLPGKAQFWINFGWSEPHCRNCQSMERTLRMNNKQAADYHRTIHKYGQKIEKEARKHNRYWDQSAKSIYRLRMERDRRVQRVLSSSQFRSYVRMVREDPRRIHDYRGWYNNPQQPHYRPSAACRSYEDNYWRYQWDHSDKGNGHRDDDRRDDDRRDDDRHDRGNRSNRSKDNQHYRKSH